jgi:peptidyl-prolyl cis-trans isomerase A (cyclophilin A)
MAVAKRKHTKKCPICKVEVKFDRLESHMKTVHHGEMAPTQAAPRKGPADRRPAMFAAVAIITVLVVAAVGIYYLGRTPEEKETPSTNPPSSNEPVPTDYATIATDRGNIVIGLYGNETPITVNNFKQYSSTGFYAGTIFHRVARPPNSQISVIQGGGFTPDLNEKTHTLAPINLEISPKLHNVRGTIAMARTTDPNSATSQFYINFADDSTGKLDPGGFDSHGYAVFGVVVQGMDVVDAIGNVATSTQTAPHGETLDDVPVTPIIIHNVVMQQTPPPQG